MAMRLIVYRPGWRLTWLGRLAALSVIAVLILLGARLAYPFLAVNQPIATDSLVIEGWLEDVTLGSVVAEIGSGRYAHVYLTGGPILKNDPASRFSSYPDLLEATLIQRGIRPDLLVSVPSAPVVKDRTYASARALADWLHVHRTVCPSFNLLSQGPHARRSWLLFGKAFGARTRIGIIPAPPEGYEPRVWWRTSAGVREMVGEMIAYVYARFFFHP